LRLELIRFGEYITYVLTKDDIAKLIEVFATKEDLERLRDDLATKEQFEKVIEKLDSAYGELKDFRQEQTVHASQHEEIKEDINDLKHQWVAPGLWIEKTWICHLTLSPTSCVTCFLILP